MGLRLQLILDFYLGTFLHIILKPFVMIAGKILHRDHDLRKCRTVSVVKMLGGGSLTIAYPALVAIKEMPGVERLQLMTTPAVKPFGESLGIFDEIVVIRTDSPFHLMIDSFRAVRKFFLCDVLIDLEIYSRLTTVFALITFAKNRVGFYTSDSFWRKYLSTHLMFCNTKRGIYHFYDQIAELFSTTVKPFVIYQAKFRNELSVVPRASSNNMKVRYAISPCASELSRERMLLQQEWIEIVRRKLSTLDAGCIIELRLYGAPTDRLQLQALAGTLRTAFPHIEVTNRAGETRLMESIREIAAMDELICIDSALLHYARLLGLPVTSYWGPTDPESLLRPRDDVKEETHYSRVPCSPCVHLADSPPCRGDNICMRLAVNPELPIQINRAWIIADQEATRFTPRDGP